MIKRNFRFHKNVIISSFIFIIGFLTINILYFEADKLTFQNELFDSLLPSSAENVLAYIDEFNSKYSLLAEVLASEFDPYEYYNDGAEDSEAVISRLKDLKEKTGVKTAGYVSLLSDIYYDSSGSVLKLDYNSERDRWISDFIFSDKDVKSTFYDPEDSQNLFAIYNDAKIYDDNGYLTGILGLEISFNSAAEGFRKTGNNKAVFFTDKSAVFDFPSKVRGESFYSMYGIDESKYKLSKNNSVQYENVIYLPEENRYVVLYSEYISTIDKFLVIELDITEIYHDIRNQFLSSFIAGLLLSIAIVAGNIYVIGHSNKKHFRRAYKDPLTGTFNRRYIDYCISERGFTSGEKSLITLDIDNFKEINDTRGHLEGDEILKTVSEISRSSIRDNDTVIRWGGDEFIIFVNADVSDANVVAERIRTEFESRTGVSITAGIASIADDEIFESALERADAALYKAKNEGRNRVYTSI